MPIYFNLQNALDWYFHFFVLVNERMMSYSNISAIKKAITNIGCINYT